jgi:hypothetical protein
MPTDIQNYMNSLNQRMKSAPAHMGQRPNVPNWATPGQFPQGGGGGSGGGGSIGLGDVAGGLGAFFAQNPDLARSLFGRVRDLFGSGSPTPLINMTPTPIVQSPDGTNLGQNQNIQGTPDGTNINSAPSDIQAANNAFAPASSIIPTAAAAGALGLGLNSLLTGGKAGVIGLETLAGANMLAPAAAAATAAIPAAGLGVGSILGSGGLSAATMNPIVTNGIAGLSQAPTVTGLGSSASGAAGSTTLGSALGTLATGAAIPLSMMGIGQLLTSLRDTPARREEHFQDWLRNTGLTPEQGEAYRAALLETEPDRAFWDPNSQMSLAYMYGGAPAGYGFAAGGLASLTQGPGDGMSDSIPTSINGSQPAALSDGEFVIPADVVSHLGNGSTDAGAKQLYAMMERIRAERTGNPEQGRQIDPSKILPV